MIVIIMITILPTILIIRIRNKTTNNTNNTTTTTTTTTTTNNNSNNNNTSKEPYSGIPEPTKQPGSRSCSENHMYIYIYIYIYMFGKSLGRNTFRIEPNWKRSRLEMSPIQLDLSHAYVHLLTNTIWSMTSGGVVKTARRQK